MISGSSTQRAVSTENTLNLMDKDEEARTRLNGASVERLISVLENPNQHISMRAFALDTLLDRDETAVIEAIISFIRAEKKHEDLRRHSIRGLGLRKRTQAIDALVEALNDASRSTRTYAITALGRMKDSRAYESLVTMLDHPDPETRSSVIHALSELRDARAIIPLLSLFEDENAAPKLRTTAAYSLSQLTRRRILGTFMEASVHDNETIASSAIHALSDIREGYLPTPLAKQHPSFILDPSIHGEDFEETEARFRRYHEHLESIRDKLPPGASAYAFGAHSSSFDDHGFPHDSWIEEVRMEVSSPGTFFQHSGLERGLDIYLRLLGSYNDGYIEFHYKNIGDSSLVAAMEWMYDEVQLTDEGRVLHQIRFDGDNYWRIECEDFTYVWIPFDNQQLTTDS